MRHPRGGKSLVLVGRLPRYYWPRMVTPQVIVGNVTGSERDRAYLADLLRLGAEKQPVRYDAKLHRAAFDGLPALTDWSDQRSKNFQK